MTGKLKRLQRTVAAGTTNTEVRVLRVGECKKKEREEKFGNRRVPWADGPSDGFIVAVHNLLYQDSYGSGHSKNKQVSHDHCQPKHLVLYTL